MKHLFVFTMVIVSFLCGWYGKPTKIKTITEIEYDCTKAGNFEDICRNFLGKEQLKDCIEQWEAGYKEGYRKAKK